MISLAVLEYEGRILYAEHAPSPHEPHSAVTELIQGIWARDPGLARKILRARIHATTPHLSTLERGMVKVAAKRITPGYSATDLRQLLDPESKKPWERVRSLPTPELLQPGFNSNPMAIAISLEKGMGAEPQSALYERDRRVAAILLSPAKKLLAAALNTNAQDRTRHAEVNLIQGWWAREGKPLPKGCEIHVTVQCCRMCAGMIWDTAEDPWSIQVHYQRTDPGPMARGTILQANSPERRLITTARQQLDLALEIQASIPSNS